MNTLRNNSKIICPHCGYSLNHDAAIKCEGCGKSLTLTQQKTQLFEEDEVILFDIPKQDKKVSHQTKYQPLKSNSVQKKSTAGQKPELLKPQNLSGIVVILFSLYLWNDHLFANSNNAKTKIEEGQKLELVGESGIRLVKAIRDVKDVPNGVFPYTNEGFFAALLREGFIKEIVEEFPNFEIKYFPPANLDPSYSASVQSLIRGDIDFLPLARPLTSTEYNKAQLKGIELKESAISRDGIVFYTNPDLKVDKITVAQLMAIFKGEINNWNQFGGEDLQITPVILSKENVESLGFDVGNANVKYVSSHTQAIRKIISTPGAVGYASASLIRDQKLIKSLILGRANRIDGSIEYVNPFLPPGIPNKKALENGSYPIVRSLSLVWIDNNPRSRSAGQAIANILLSLEGQAMVDRAGFVPLRNQNK